MTVQLRAAGGTCWEASYHSAGVIENGAGRFLGLASMAGELPP